MRETAIRLLAGSLMIGSAVLLAAAAEAQTTGLPPLDPGSLPATSSKIPPGISWSAPELPAGPIPIESAVEEHRELEVAIIARDLQQPWSIAFLPDGDMLVTERAGQLRRIHDGVLDPEPVAGVPEVRTGGLQGLMDVVLHPDFERNRFV